MVSYKIFSHFSLGRSVVHIDELVKQANELKLNGLALTDFNSLSGVMEFLNECEKFPSLLPIVGMTTCTEINGAKLTFTLLAKNKLGYYQLVRLLSSLNGDIVDINLPLDQTIVILEHTDQILVPVFERLNVQILFSKLPGQTVDTLKYPVLSTHCVYYTKLEDKICKDILWANETDTTVDQLPDVGADNYLRNDLPDHNTDLLIPLFEKYSIKSPAQIPKFKCENSNEYLKQLCREGWVKTGLGKIPKDSPLYNVYVDRIKEELKVFCENGLADYMLIIKDVVSFVQSSKMSIGLRGSAAGCLVSYLIGISDIDPVRPDPTLEYSPDRCLLFSRFYNSARKGSLPDIDIDLPPSARPLVKDYILRTYGESYVASYIAAFSRYDGRGAVKAVFRALGSASPEDVNEITKIMLSKDKIQDDLEDIRQEKPKYNTVDFNIEFVPELKQYYETYTKEFDLAKKLANTISAMTKHAAGIVISSQKIYEQFPVFKDENNHYILGFEMKDAEMAGAVKYDLLCVNAYEKIDKIIQMITSGSNEPEVGIEDEED